jgi:hypothetical protein
MWEDPAFIYKIKNYYKGPIKLRKGKKANKKIKKFKGLWIPIKRKYHRSLFMKRKCKLYDTNLTNENKIKFLEFFFKWFRKRPRAYLITKVFSQDGEINDKNLKNGDKIIISFVVYKAAWKKIIASLDKEDLIIPDYKRIRRVGHAINFTFLFYDLDKSTQDLMFDFSGQGYDDCNLLIILNKYYLKHFYEAEKLFAITTWWYGELIELRQFKLFMNVYTYKHEFLFEYWKAYKRDLWYRKYWDPEWPRIIGEMMFNIRYYAKEHIINTKRYALNVSREVAIKLVAEDKARAKAENIILKAEMKKKLAALDMQITLKSVAEYLEENEKKGIVIPYNIAFREIVNRRKRADEIWAEAIAINVQIAKEEEAERIRTYQPKLRDLRIFKF